MVRSLAQRALTRRASAGAVAEHPERASPSIVGATAGPRQNCDRLERRVHAGLMADTA